MCKRLSRTITAFLLVAMLSTIGWADQLFLRDDRVVEGTIVGVTAEHVLFRTAPDLVKSIALDRVRNVSFAPREEDELPITYMEWERSMATARRRLDGCRLGRSGLIGGGLLFVGGGQYLMWVGEQTLGGLLTGMGAIVSLFGVASPPPDCREHVRRVEALTRIGLEFGWVY